MEGQWTAVLIMVLLGIVFIKWGHTRGRFNAIPKEQQRPWGPARFIGIAMITLAGIAVVQRLINGHWN